MIEVPPAFAGRESASGALRLNALLLITAGAWGAFFLQHAILGYVRVATIDAIACLVTLLVRWWAFRSGADAWIMRGGHLVLGVSCAALVAVALLSGQDRAMSTWYLTVIPLFAAYHMGTRAAIGWSVVAVLLLLGVHFSELLIRPTPDYVPGPETWLMGRVVLLLVLLGFSIATRRAMDLYTSAIVEREGIIRERAQELAEARDAALEAVRVKNEFLANMSHEIRTPLNGIIGMTSVLLTAEQPQDQREVITTIQRSSNTLLTIINEILDFSRLEAGARAPEKLPFDLRECIEDVIDMFARDAWHKGIDLVAIAHSDLPRWVEGDVTYVRQVLVNLVANAVKFTDRGDVVVEARPGPADGEIEIEVSDTGVGIPPQKQEAVFESFSQADSSTTRKYGGTGLGLAISKRLVELMGGTIELHSEVGVGTSFRVVLPVPEATAPERPLTTHERVNLIGKYAAIVGGRPASRDALREMLRAWGVQVDGGDGSAPQLVFEFMDGRVRGDQARQKGPVIALVPFADREGHADAQRRGVAAVVHWPARAHALRQAAEAVVGGKNRPLREPLGIFDSAMGARVPARILVAEDNPVNQQVAKTVLRRLGYAPDVVSSGREVLEALRDKPYDVLFMDLHMPDLDGVTAARRIREELPDDKQPWIVALTASVGAAQRDEARAAGMDDFVGKPFDVQRLMIALERYVAERGYESLPIPTRQALDATPWEQLRSMFAREPGRLADLVEHHVQNGRSLVRELREATPGDLEAVRAAAHSLKSSSAQFGSDDVSRLAGRLESAAREAAIDDAEALLGELLDAWQSAERRLNQEARSLRRADV